MRNILKIGFAIFLMASTVAFANEAQNTKETQTVKTQISGLYQAGNHMILVEEMAPVQASEKTQTAVARKAQKENKTVVADSTRAEPAPKTAP